MIQEFILAIIPTIVECTIAPIKRQIGYAFIYKSNIKNLRKEVDELENARDRVKHSVDAAERNVEKIEQDVGKWLIEVDETTKAAKEMLEDEGKANKKCFIGFCPNFKNRYQLGRKAGKAAMSISKLHDKDSFDTISYHADSHGMDAMYIEDYEAFHSRDSVFEDIIHALAVAEADVIGLHGIGGVGKTTLVKKIAQKVIEDKLFHVVSIVDVTKAPDLKRMQGDIAYVLGGLRLDKENERERASKLRERLTNELKNDKKILIIFDDLWNKIDLETVGVPFKDDRKGCKILLTSRYPTILSEKMDCHYNFAIDTLPEKESWELFKKMAGNNFDNPTLQVIASEVAKKCSGLPIAIVTVARTLKNKSLELWENSLRELEKPSSRNSKGMEAVKYSPIELSYDHLEKQELKQFFCLCSLLGNNSYIRDLLKYGISLGYFGTRIPVDKARNKAHSLVHELKGFYLLLHSDTIEQFAMHDNVRDVGILINFTDHNVFTQRDDDELEEWPNDSCKGIWLHCRISELPDKLSYPQLEFFRMHAKDPNPRLPDNIFIGMLKLKVLALINFSFSSFPSSLTLLENLRTLCLDESMLRDITLVGTLKKLEILSFAKCNIRHLPEELGQLSNLKLLDLSDYSELEVIPPNIISKLSLLEELYMGNSFDNWEIKCHNNRQQNNASLAELKCLSHLTNLEIHIRDVEVMEKDLFFEKLSRYKIFVGHVGVWDGVYETRKTLKLKLDRSIIDFEDCVQTLLKSSEDLYLHELKGVKNVLYELNKEGFPQLKHFHLFNSPEIHYIINPREGVHFKPFPMLESLFLYDLVSLYKICDGNFREQPFNNLRIIEVNNCKELKNLFPFSVAHGLSQLQKVKVTYCQQMEEIVTEESEAHANKNKAIDEIQFTQLRTLSLEGLQKLKSFCSKEGTPLLSKTRSKMSANNARFKEIISEDELRTPMPLFTEKIVFPKLEELELKRINTERLWHGQFPTIGLSIESLSRLVVNGCHNLKYLFSSSMVKSLVQLKYLEVNYCELMEEIIVTEGLEDEQERISNLLFPKLDFLCLCNLSKLMRFCTGCRIECPQLKSLHIRECPKLKTFISSYANAISKEDKYIKSEESLRSDKQSLFDEKVAFPKLTEMHLSLMENLEKIWHNQLFAPSFDALRTLEIWSCEKLLNIFPCYMLKREQRLEKLTISHCSSLEEIFELQGLNVDKAQAVRNFHLRDISLSFLPKLKHLWDTDPQGIFTFGNLHSVYVCRCEVLRNVFPFSIARDLLQLEKLEICYCGLEEIVAKQENGETTVPDFTFPKLISLRLSNLSKFRSFYGGVHTLEWPLLKKLEAWNCENVNLFASKFQEISGEVGQPLFVVEKVIPNLEELSLHGQDTTTTPIIWAFQFPTAFRSKLKILKLQSLRDKLDVSPFGFVRRFLNLETLILDSCSFKVIFSYEGLVTDEDEHVSTLERLRNLKISFLHDLRLIWEHDNRLVPLLQNLQTLKVWRCHSLINLAPSFASFQNLTNLEVSNCGGLLNLITSSTAKSLAQLIELKVSNCSAVTEIVAKEEDETKDENEIILSKLEVLVLDELRDLTSFSLGNYTFKFPSLEKVVVDKCLKMRIFSPGNLSTPKLRKVLSDQYSDDRVHWEGNLNRTIQHMYREMVGFDGKWNLKLSKFPQLKEAWHIGRLPVKFFSNLGILEVDDCDFFSTALPSNLLPFLKHLTDLTIRNCNSLEGIFDFEKLNAEEGHVQLLPELRELCLIDLPNLSSICVGSGVLEFPSMKKITVDNCPKMKRLIHSIFLREQEARCQHIPIVLLVNDEVAFPNLEGVRVDWNDAMEEIQHGQLQDAFCCKLKSLKFVRFPNHKVGFPTHFLSRFPNLQSLAVNDAFFEEIVLHEETHDEGKRLGDLTKLKKLKLSKLPRLVHLSKEDSGLCSTFQILEALEVLECGKLKMLVPSSVSFQYLRSLEVSQCHGLIKLITSTTAKSLVQLETMRITECQMIEEIMAKVENEVENEITFSKLICLELRCLPNLTSFHLGNLALLFPSLEYVKVGECPMMKIFSQGGASTIKLESLQLTNQYDRRCWQGNLNATVQHLFKEMSKAPAESQLPSSSKQSTLDVETTQAEKNTMFASTEGLDSENSCVTENSHDNKDLSLEVKTSVDLMIEETTTKSTLIEPKVIQVASAHPDSRAISSDKDQVMLASTIQLSSVSPISPAITVEQAYTSTSASAVKTHVHKDPQATDEDQVIIASTIQQTAITPLSPAATVEQASASTSASPIKTTSFEMPICGAAFTSTSEITSNQITERSSHSPANFECLFAALEQWQDSNPVSSSQPAPNSNVECHKSSGLSLDTYGYCLALIKKIIMKPLAEVARSADGLLLLSILDNLKNCPLLNIQQSKMIQVYIENFDSLVTYHPFYEQQINRISTLDVTTEDNKQTKELKTLYEDLRSKSTTLSADKKELKKRLHEIEEEEDYIQAKMEDLYAQLATRKGKLQAHVKAEERASHANDYWAKFQNLFA